MDREQRKRWTLTGSVILFGVAVVSGQCSSTITAFPYNEGFEGAPAWTAGGTNSDWAWGTPAHPNINSAAEGTNAWCVGGLTGSFYANGQQSWLESPCFDLSLLDYPYISFQIHWETESGYDGAGLQYSPNEGVTWINVGEVGDDDCLNRNWFNSTNITALNLASPRQGWSGTATSGGCASGGGSGGWVLAAHCLDDLPTDAPVKFRFIFGAGTICNTFDGVAIDDIYIGEAPTLDPAISFTCAGNTVNFSNGATLCPGSSVWDFGDPGSGANNTADQPVASHTYPGPGTYTVTLTMTGPCTAPVTVTEEVVIAELEIQAVDVGCTPNSGSATAVITGSNGPFSYDWTPGNGNTQTITGLSPGEYTVLVQAADMCPVQGTVEIVADGTTVTVEVDHVDVSCAGLTDGSATVSASGGSGTYTYTWSPDVGTTATVSDLAPGVYVCTVQDDAGCAGEVEVTITGPEALVLTVPDGPVICEGQSVELTANVVGGTPDYTFNWSPAGPTVTPAQSTSYTVTAVDANGCVSDEGVILVEVTDAITPSFTWDLDRGCAPLCVTFTDGTVGAGIRQWTFGDGGSAGDEAQPVHCFIDDGVFDVTLTITTADGCVGTQTAVGAIQVQAGPEASFAASPEVALIDDPTFRFTDLSLGASAWSWSFGDPLASSSTERSPTFTYPGTGCYTVTLDVASDAGCQDSTEGVVCVEDAFALYAPNSFSPNNDGINDGFVVRTTVSAPDYFQMNVFDRWGTIIHTSDDLYEAWDGSGLPQGVYSWQVRLRDSKDKLQERQGHVTLIR